MAVVEPVNELRHVLFSATVFSHHEFIYVMLTGYN